MEGLDGLLQKMRRKEIKRSIRDRKGQVRDKLKSRQERYKGVSHIEGIEEAKKEEKRRVSSLNDKGLIEEEEESAIDINIIDNSPRENH